MIGGLIRPLVASLAVFVGVTLVRAAEPSATPTVLVVEGEFFTPQENAPGRWKVTAQDHSYASHTYGGMWVMNGALLGAPADSVDAVATRTITVPADGAYRVWSKYQAPPYFNYLHRIEVVQNGKTVFTHVYGKVDAPRFWSFSAGMHKHIWWFWGMDHDAAEAPPEMANLTAGEAELRITSVAQPPPAGDRFIDFVVLTTEPGDTYLGYKPYRIGSPFLQEAIHASRLYARFRNTSGQPAVLTARTPVGHLQPLYGGQRAQFPDKDSPVEPGAWSPWFNLASILRLAHDEGVIASLPDEVTFDLQLARDEQGRDLVADLQLASGETFVIPMDIAWNKDAKVLPSRQHAANIVALARSQWRAGRAMNKPRKIAFYGAFGRQADMSWINELKDALGFNTLLPDPYERLEKDGHFAHTPTAEAIRKYAEKLSPEERARMRILSFGDEIHLGQIDYADPQNNEQFRTWLREQGLTEADLGVDPSAATLSNDRPRLAWYSRLFNERQRFAAFADNTRLAEELFHPGIRTGANYSPHHAPQYYGPIHQWVDLFRHRGMSAFWTEDYIFSVPEPPQVISWMFATMFSAVKYHDLPIHFYVMPHAPGQTPENLRRNMVFAIGSGALNIDSFWVAPAENFTENFVSWGYLDSFRVLHDSIYDAAEVEDLSVGGRRRPARVAIVLSKATEFNEHRLPVDPGQDPFASRCSNFPQGGWEQTLCRKDQQLLYLALRHDQHRVDLITEDDINEGVNSRDILAGYDVIYFAGQWIDDRAARKLDAWVQAGGVLYAAAGLGERNQFDQPESALPNILGVQSVALRKNAYHLRPLLELPLVEPIDTITLEDGQQVRAIAMKQVLRPEDSSVKVVGTWSDGTPAVTVRRYGLGKAIAVGTLPGHTYYKTGVRAVPFARGGYTNLYNPEGFDPAAAELALLGVRAKHDLERDVTCSDPRVEALVLDHDAGTLVTLVNWSDEPMRGLRVTLPLAEKPASARLVAAGTELAVEHTDGAASFTLDLPLADFVVLQKRP